MKTYRYKLIFPDSHIWYLHIWYLYDSTEDSYVSEFAKADIVIDLWLNKYVKHRYGDLGWVVINSNNIKDHKRS